MTTIAAKGYTAEGVPAYLWNYGNYLYGIFYGESMCSEVVEEDIMTDTSYEAAVEKFKLVATKDLTIY